MRVLVVSLVTTGCVGVYVTTEPSAAPLGDAGFVDAGFDAGAIRDGRSGIDAGTDAAGASDVVANAVDAPADVSVAGDGAVDPRDATLSAVDVGASDTRIVSAYDPCPPVGTACRIMPLGDSITRGNDAGGYRAFLFAAAVRAGRTITLVGSERHGPASVEGVPFPSSHEGHSGWTIDDGGGRSGITAQVTRWVTAASPHIVLLMIGTNDLNIALDVPDAPRRLGVAIDRITEAAPNALLVIARITPSRIPALNSVIAGYNDAIPGVVAPRVAAGRHITVVDMESAFLATPDYMRTCLGDDLHPLPLGYEVMSRVWWSELDALLR